MNPHTTTGQVSEQYGEPWHCGGIGFPDDPLRRWCCVYDRTRAGMQSGTFLFEVRGANSVEIAERAADCVTFCVGIATEDLRRCTFKELARMQVDEFNQKYNALKALLEKPAVPLGDLDLLEQAWCIIANASGGNWDLQHPDWRAAAVRFREKYHARLGSLPPAPGAARDESQKENIGAAACNTHDHLSGIPDMNRAARGASLSARSDVSSPSDLDTLANAIAEAIDAEYFGDDVKTPPPLREIAERLITTHLKPLFDERERLIEALTPSGDTKAAYHGEFRWEENYDDGSDCRATRTVPWTTVKEIMAAIRTRAAALSAKEPANEK